MELRQLKSFVAVAEELHFARAAERLHLAQQPLSAQIKKLEQTLGVQLFIRTTRKVELTEAGLALLPEARLALDHAARGAQSASLAAQGALGQLRVGYISTTLYNVMPATMRGFRARFPEVDIVLHERCSPDLEEAVVSGELHAAFVMLQPGHPDLSIDPLCREQVLVALPKGHPLSAQPRVPLASLAREPLINYDRAVAPAVSDGVIALCRSGGFGPKVVQSAGSDQAVLGLVAAGLGAAFVSACLARVRDDEIDYRVLTPSSTVAYGLAVRRGKHLPLIQGLRHVARETANRTAPAGPADGQRPGMEADEGR